MKTLSALLIIIGSIFLINPTIQAQSWRVDKLRSDSVELNKMVYALVASREGSTEWKYMIENLNKKFPKFMNLLIKDALPSHYLGVLDFVNKNTAQLINLQIITDKLTMNHLKIRRYYIDMGYSSIQANELVLKNAIMESCFKNYIGKDAILCITSGYRQYLEAIETFTPSEINNLVLKVQKSLEQKYFKNSKIGIKKSSSKH